MPGQTARENGKRGGRPKGRKNDATLEREAVQRAINQRIMQLADRLISAQVAHAEGVMMLFRRKKTGGPAERVTSEAEIKAYLDRDGAGESEDDASYWYWLAAKDPSADAADRLLNRTFGRAKESVEHSGSVTVPGVVMFGISKAPDADCHD